MPSVRFKYGKGFVALATRYRGRLSINANSGGTLEIAEFLERMKRVWARYNTKELHPNMGRLKRRKTIKAQKKDVTNKWAWGK